MERGFWHMERAEGAGRAGGAGGAKERNPLQKSVQLLNWMVEALPNGGGVREMASALRLAPSTVHRMLRMLEEEKLVRADRATGQYHLGYEFLRLAWRATARFPITSVALPLMRELVEACNETAILGLYDPVQREMMFAATVQSQHPLRYQVELNRWMPVYAGATGLAIMAFLPEGERREIAASTGLAPLTPNTVTDPAALERQMEQIRRQGYACTMGQRIPGAVGLGAPIWGPEGRVVGDLALTVPEQRFEASWERELARLLIHYAHRISDQLGARPPGTARPDGAG